MAKKETVYDVVFALYDLTYSTESKKNKMRKYINRHLENEYGKGCKWDDLTLIQKDTFIYVTLRQGMFDKYVDSSKRAKISAVIDSYIKKTFLDSSKTVQQHNSLIAPIFEDYSCSSDTDSMKEEKYNLLRTVIQNFNPHVPIPSFEEWEKKPLRPYDYIASYENEPPTYEEEYIPTQAEIDHIVLQVLLKFVKEQMNLDINTKLISECLTFLTNFDADRYDTMLDEYDPSLKLSKEEQEKIIIANRQYFTYKKMLDNLSFT